MKRVRHPSKRLHTVVCRAPVSGFENRGAFFQRASIDTSPFRQALPSSGTYVDVLASGDERAAGEAVPAGNAPRPERRSSSVGGSARWDVLISPLYLYPFGGRVQGWAREFQQLRPHLRHEPRICPCTTSSSPCQGPALRVSDVGKHGVASERAFLSEHLDGAGRCLTWSSAAWDRSSVRMRR